MKKQVTQDELYDYLTAHGVKVTRLAKLMGVTAGMVIGCFKHNIDKYGKPRNFTANGLPKLNEALAQMASELAQFQLPFGSDQTYTNQRGATYDPALVPIIKNDVGCYFKLNVVCENVLGWKSSRKSVVFCAPSSKVYGCISKDDVDRINAEIRAVADTLAGWEVVAADGGGRVLEGSRVSSSRAKGEGSRVEGQGSMVKGERLMVKGEGAGRNAWNDTSLGLQERWRLFREQYPNGILFFRVLDGYTVAQDDTEIVGEIDAELKPYTDPSTGLVTTFIPSAKLDTLLPRLIRMDHRVCIVEMYDV